MADIDVERIRALIREVPDFPKPGIGFKDITPLLEDHQAFSEAIPAMWEPWEGERIDCVVGVEARGFIFAAPIALHCGAGFVPIRKPGKLPHEIESEEYELEYGSDLIEIHRDAISPGDRVLVVDDVIATGGTAAATCRLVEKLGGEVAGLSFLIELTFLGGRDLLVGRQIESIIRFE